MTTNWRQTVRHGQVVVRPTTLWIGAAFVAACTGGVTSTDPHLHAVDVGMASRGDTGLSDPGDGGSLPAIDARVDPRHDGATLPPGDVERGSLRDAGSIAPPGFPLSFAACIARPGSTMASVTGVQDGYRVASPIDDGNLDLPERASSATRA